jgi:hypothetical protein
MIVETAVMIFGRFQPPTKAHIELFDRFLEVAYQSKEPVHGQIFISPAFDNKRNPLSLSARYDFLSKLYPHINFLADPEIKNPFQAVHYLGGLGIHKVILIAGTDQAPRLRQQLTKYIHNPNPELTFLNIEEIKVIEFGRRDPDSKDFIESCSATKARQAVKDGQFSLFCEIIPECSLFDQTWLYDEISKGLGISK